MERTIKRGDIYYAELNPVIGSEQGGKRPVLIISNDIGNKHSPMMTKCGITRIGLYMTVILTRALQEHRQKSDLLFCVCSMMQEKANLT